MVLGSAGPTPISSLVHGVSLLLDWLYCIACFVIGFLGFHVAYLRKQEALRRFFGVVCGRLVIVCLRWASSFAPPPTPRERGSRRHLAQAQTICCSALFVCLSAWYIPVHLLFCMFIVLADLSCVQFLRTACSSESAS